LFFGAVHDPIQLMALNERRNHGKKDISRPIHKVYFFGTCLMDAVYPDAGMAAIRLLESLGVRVVFPRTSPAAASRLTIPAFPGRPGPSPATDPGVFQTLPDRGAVRILCRHDEAPLPDAVCRHADEDAARRFSERVVEWSEYLATVLAVNSKIGAIR
jgi:L-lactate dehydrogenase complex protein LldE